MKKQFLTILFMKELYASGIHVKLNPIPNHKGSEGSCR